MGKVPQEFVPVKYANESSQGQGNVMLNFLIGSLFVLLLFQLYRSMHGGKGSGTKGTGKNVSGKDSSSGSGGGMFGGKGGMGDIFGMGKSNV